LDAPRPLGKAHRGVRLEPGPRQRGRARWQLRYAVDVGRVGAQRSAGLGENDVVLHDLEIDGPDFTAVRVLLDQAAQGLPEHLMPEADSENRNLRVDDTAQVRLPREDPVRPIRHASRGARDHDARKSRPAPAGSPSRGGRTPRSGAPTTTPPRRGSGRRNCRPPPERFRWARRQSGSQGVWDMGVEARGGPRPPADNRAAFQAWMLPCRTWPGRPSPRCGPSRGRSRSRSRFGIATGAQLVAENVVVDVRLEDGNHRGR